MTTYVQLIPTASLAHTSSAFTSNMWPYGGQNWPQYGSPITSVSIQTGSQVLLNQCATLMSNSVDIMVDRAFANTGGTYGSQLWLMQAPQQAQLLNVSQTINSYLSLNPLITKLSTYDSNTGKGSIIDLWQTGSLSPDGAQIELLASCLSSPDVSLKLNPTAPNYSQVQITGSLDIDGYLTSVGIDTLNVQVNGFLIVEGPAQVGGAVTGPSFTTTARAVSGSVAPNTLYNDNTCAAWVTFVSSSTGTTTIHSFNVTSVTAVPAQNNAWYVMLANPMHTTGSACCVATVNGTTTGTPTLWAAILPTTNNKIYVQAWGDVEGITGSVVVFGAQ